MEQKKTSGGSQRSAKLVMPPPPVDVLVVRWLEFLAQRTHHPLWWYWILHRSLFPRKEETVDWLSHLSRVRSVGVVHSHMLSHFFNQLHFSKMVLCHGYLRYIMLVEIASHYFRHVPDLDWGVRWSLKNTRDCLSHLSLYWVRRKLYIGRRVALLLWEAHFEQKVERKSKNKKELRKGVAEGS